MEEEKKRKKKKQPSQSNLDFPAATPPSPQPPPFLFLRRLVPSFPWPLTCLFDGNRSVHVASRKPAWVSLQGRIVGADEATSLRSVGNGGLGWEESLGWEMFTPMQRVLVVAVIAVGATAAESRKSKEVEHLQRSVEIRDELLLCMQQKLDDLCEHMYPVEDQQSITDGSFDDFHGFGMSTKTALASFDMSLSDGKKDVFESEYSKNEKFKTPQSLMTNTEQEERRMSDLSDFFSSAASSVDIQMSTLAEQQQYYNLRQECEQKDATIKDPKATILESNVTESKRIVELEDKIKRKRLVIAKLRNDLMFLEQQVTHLTRLRRPSSSLTAPDPNVNKTQLPVMSDNILYDMSSSSSSSSSSDSDCLEISNNHRSSFPLSRPVHQSPPRLLKKKKSHNSLNSDTTLETCMVSKANERRRRRRRFSDVPKRSKGRDDQQLQRRWV